MFTDKLIHLLKSQEKLFAVLLTLAVVIPVLSAFFYVYPSFDDYYYAFKTATEGFWGVQKWWYLNASGRYFSNLLLSTSVYTVHHVQLYRLLLVSIFLIFCFSIYFLAQRLTKHGSFTKDVFPFSTFIFVSGLFIQVTPGFSEFLYWFSGAGTYALSIAFVNFFIGFLFFKTTGNSTFHFFILLVIALLACGTSEFGGLFILASLCVYLFHYLYKSSWNIPKLIRLNQFWILLIITAVLFFVILKAPGNQLRFESEKLVNAQAGNMYYAAKQGITGTLKFIYNLFWVRGGGVVFLAILLYAWSSHTKHKIKAYCFPNDLMLWVVIQLLLSGLTFFIAVMYTYNTGVSVMIPRTISVLSFFWCMNIVISAFYFSGFIKLITFKKNIFIRFVATGIPFILLVSFILFSKRSNLNRLYSDFSDGKIHKYSDFQKRQINDFINCNDQQVMKSTLPEKPITFVWDLSDNNFNTRYYRYYSETLCNRAKQ